MPLFLLEKSIFCLIEFMTYVFEKMTVFYIFIIYKEVWYTINLPSIECNNDLSLLALVIGIIWLIPYMLVTYW